MANAPDKKKPPAWIPASQIDAERRKKRPSPPTRGGGLLEGWLARKRAAQADKLIHWELRPGAILDIGCGSYPLFLTSTRFNRRVGLDRDASKAVGAFRTENIELLDFDINVSDFLPFDDATFTAVTMLAVFEHIKVDRLIKVLNEAHRVLMPSGLLIMTTPSNLAEPVLKIMKRLGLVSAEEIEEHVDHYTPAKVRDVLDQTNFNAHPTRIGRFEFGLNLWITVEKV